jgi:hypothetical protein
MMPTFYIRWAAIANGVSTLGLSEALYLTEECSSTVAPDCMHFCWWLAKASTTRASLRQCKGGANRAVINGRLRVAAR